MVATPPAPLRCFGVKRGGFCNKRFPFLFMLWGFINPGVGGGDMG